METLKVLIVDDENELRKSVVSILNNTLPDFQFNIDEASNGIEALNQVRNSTYDMVLMDVKMPEMNGIEALTKIKEHDPRTFVVLMTAHSNLQDAVLAIKEGAYDYLEKPVDPKRLSEILRQAVEAREMVSSLMLSNPIFDDDIDSEFVGHSQKMKEVFYLIHKLCKVDTTVLIRGENGTGKELVARAIHYNSPRKNGNFVAINCGAIPEALMESELFGHEKGAFTGAIERKIGKFQLANNGTLFLDEIGELKPEMQVKLLRVLQERKFVPVGGQREIKTNTRIIAATNRNLEKMIEDRLFREDLFYRLNVLPIFLPPLRERVDDIPDLVHHFIKKIGKKHPTSIKDITPEALETLKRYQWPGNIRELENIIERAFIIENSEQIQAASLPENVKSSANTMINQTLSSTHSHGGGIGISSGGGGGISGDNINNNSSNNSNISSSTINNIINSTNYDGPLNYDLFKEQVEKDFIISALKANKGKINQTVAHANIPKNTLLRKIKKYGIYPDDYKE